MFIAMNHPNAFMDPISFATFLFYPRTYYMARGDAFKKGFASMALQSMGIVPIFRMRDAGFEGVKKNLESFKVTYKLLDQKKRIMVFAEGLSVKERRLRPIQKGTAKMSFGYLEQGGNMDLKIVPVGVNYSEPEKFRSYVFFHVGEPIAVKDLYEEYKKEPARAIVKLTALLEERMKPLVPSLLHRENDVVIEQLQFILKRQYMDEHKLDHRDAAQQQQYWDFIIKRLNELTEKDPVGMENFRKQVDQYHHDLQRLGLRDHLLYKASRNQKLITPLHAVLLVLGFPFYIIGKALNFIPYYLAKRTADKKVKNIEFKASIAFGSGALLLNLFFVLELLLVWLLFRNWHYLWMYALIKFIGGLIALTYSPFSKKNKGALRLKALKRTDPGVYDSLLRQRQQILDFVGDFH